MERGTSLRFPSPASAWTLFGVGTVVWLFFATITLGVVLDGHSKSAVHTVWFLSLGAFTSWLVLHAAAHFVRAVIVDEHGLVIQRVIPSRRILWSDVAAVELRYEPKSDKRRRMNTIRLAILRLRPRGAPEELDGDPVDLRELRPGCLVAATVFGADGARIAFFPGYVGWAFADALGAEADRRGIAIRRGRGPTDCPP
jgi:hypothetical protein